MQLRDKNSWCPIDKNEWEENIQGFATSSWHRAFVEVVVRKIYDTANGAQKNQQVCCTKRNSFRGVYEKLAFMGYMPLES